MATLRAGRRGFLQAATVAGAGLSVAGAWRWRVGSAAAQSPAALDALNLALTGEYMQQVAYQAVLDADSLEQGDLESVQAMLAETQRNTEAMRQAITLSGAQPIEQPPYNFPADELADRRRALELLLRIENLGTSGWIGSQGLTTDPTAITVGVALFGRKARRAAALAMLLGEPATPFAGAFEAGTSLPQVLAQVEPYRGGR